VLALDFCEMKSDIVKNILEKDFACIFLKGAALFGRDCGRRFCL